MCIRDREGAEATFQFHHALSVLSRNTFLPLLYNSIHSYGLHFWSPVSYTHLDVYKRQARGTVSAVAADPASQIGPFLSGAPEAPLRPRAGKANLFAHGTIRLSTSQIHTVKPLEVAIPKGRLTVVTGVSGSGKDVYKRQDLADRQHVRARLCGAHPVVAGGRWPDRHLFSYALAQCLPPSAGKRCVSAPEV